MVQIHQMDFQDNPLARNFESYSRPGLNLMLAEFQEDRQHQRNLARQTEQNKQFLKGISPFFEKLGIDRKSVNEMINFGVDPGVAINLAKQNLEYEKLRQNQKRSENLANALRTVSGFESVTPKDIVQNQLLGPDEIPGISKNTPPKTSPTGLMQKEEQIAENIPETKPLQKSIPSKQATRKLTDRQFDQLLASVDPRDQPALIRARQQAQTLDLQEKAQQHKIKAEEAKERRAQQKFAREETKKYREQVESSGNDAEEQNKTLDFMDKLVDSNKLTNPVVAEVADRYGILGLLSPETQLFQKALGQFLPNMANLYGARVTNQHEKIFMNTLPRINQTDAGKKKLIQMLKIENNSRIIKRDMYRQIMKENKGVPPLDINEQVDKRARPLLDKNFEDMMRLVSGDKIRVRLSDGRVGLIPSDKLSQAAQLGAEVLND